MEITQLNTRQRLLNSARDLIYARSYADVGVQEICECANVKKGSFYHFFPSKRDLTLAVLDDLWDQLRTGILDQAFVSDVSPLARIKRFLQMTYEFQRQVKEDTGQVLGCPYGNLGGELSTQDEPIRKRINRIFQDVQRPIEQALREAVAAGEIPAQDTAHAAEALFAFLEGVVLIAKTRNDPELIGTLNGMAMRLIGVPD